MSQQKTPLLVGAIALERRERKEKNLLTSWMSDNLRKVKPPDMEGTGGGWWFLTETSGTDVAVNAPPLADACRPSNPSSFLNSWYGSPFRPRATSMVPPPPSLLCFKTNPSLSMLETLRGTRQTKDSPSPQQPAVQDPCWRCYCTMPRWDDIAFRAFFSFLVEVQANQPLSRTHAHNSNSSQTASSTRKCERLFRDWRERWTFHIAKKRQRNGRRLLCLLLECRWWKKRPPSQPASQPQKKKKGFATNLRDSKIALLWSNKHSNVVRWDGNKLLRASILKQLERKCEGLLLPKFSKLKPPSSQNGNATTTTGAPSVSPTPQSSQKHGHLNNTLIVAGKLSKCNAAETRTHTKLLAAAVDLLQVCRSISESIKTKTPFFHVPPQVPQAQNK